MGMTFAQAVAAAYLDLSNSKQVCSLCRRPAVFRGIYVPKNDCRLFTYALCRRHAGAGPTPDPAMLDEVERRIMLATARAPDGIC